MGFAGHFGGIDRSLSVGFAGHFEWDYAVTFGGIKQLNQKYKLFKL
jgi:predicted secreted protein